uniref:Lipoprotein n=1 Tax=Geobacillus sp. (strain WCH70) TaxID=471223 RepID=C5D887_GEOSW
MQKALFVFLGMFLFLTACSTDRTIDSSTDNSTNVEYLKMEGYVVEKREHGGIYQLLVIGNITKDDLENKTKQELIKEAGGTYFYVKKEIYSKVQEGDKVVVWMEKGQPLQPSDPPEASAKKIEIINEKKAPKYQECAEGYIISKSDDSIWVISRIEKDDIQNETKKELNELFQGKGVIFDIRNISQETKMRLEEKQKVKVYCNGILKESAPSQGEAIKIEVLEE